MAQLLNLKDVDHLCLSSKNRIWVKSSKLSIYSLWSNSNVFVIFVNKEHSEHTDDLKNTHTKLFTLYLTRSTFRLWNLKIKMKLFFPKVNSPTLSRPGLLCTLPPSRSCASVESQQSPALEAHLLIHQSGCGLVPGFSFLKLGLNNLTYWKIYEKTFSD